MSLLQKFTKKNLLLNKKRTIVTVIGIILSVSLITAVSSMFFSAYTSITKYEKVSSGDYHYSFFNVPIDDLVEIRKNKKIETISVVQNIGYSKFEGIKNKYKPYVFINAYTDDSLKNLGVNLIEGRLPKNKNEILVSNHLKTNGKVNFKLGNKLNLEVGTRVLDGDELNQNNPFEVDTEEEIINTKNITYTIVGIIERPPTEIEPYHAPGYSLITYVSEKDIKENVDIYVRYNKKGLKKHLETTANILGISPSTFEKSKTLAANSPELDKLQDELDKAKYEYSFNNYLVGLETGELIDSLGVSLIVAAIVVIIIIIFTSIFCIKNSFDISLTEKIKQYGMLSSIGATKKQIKNSVYYEAIYLANIGVPLGLVFGHLASLILILITNFFLKEMLEFRIYFILSIPAILFSILLSYITVLLSARRSAKRASKISPITAIRNSENIKISKKGRKTNKFIKKIFGIGGVIAYKNIKRSKKKYRTTVISIAVCATVFITLSSFVSNMFKIIDTTYGTSSFDISISHSQINNEGIDNNLELLYSQKEITNMYHYSEQRIVSNFDRDDYTDEYLKLNEHLDNDYFNNDLSHREQIRVIILDDVSFRQFCDELNINYEKVKDKGIFKNRIYDWIISDEKYEKNKQVEVDKLKIKEKDYISGSTFKINEDGILENITDFKVEIAKLTDKLPLGRDENQYEFENVLIVNENISKDIIDKNNHAFIYIESKDVDKTIKTIDELYVNYNIFVLNVMEEAKRINSFIILIGIFLYGFIIVIALIGITNIFNTITTNMNLRQREFAMLKSIGMTKREFNHLIYLETLFYCGKSLIFSIPIGIGLSYVIYLLLSDGELIIKYRIPLMSILITIAVVFILIYIIMIYSIRKINNQNIIETIRNENI